MKTSTELRAEAREFLSGKWTPAVVSTLVFMIIWGGASAIPFVGTLLLLALSPLMYSYYVLFLNAQRGTATMDVAKIFDGFSDYKRIFVTMLLMFIYTFLWSLLLVIPGIIKGYSYAMTTYILNDDPSISGDAAIEKSMQMMQGNKMRLFLLDLSFIGWAILAILTAGIGFLWLSPYIYSARAKFYEDLKSEATVAA